jgi:hypothetical protein
MKLEAYNIKYKIPELKYIVINLCFVSFVFALWFPMQAQAAVPTFDVGLNPKMDILLCIQAAFYEKEYALPIPRDVEPCGPPNDQNWDFIAWQEAKNAQIDFIAGTGAGTQNGSIPTDVVSVVDWVKTKNIDNGPLLVQEWEDFAQFAVNDAGNRFGQEVKGVEYCQPFAQYIKQRITTGITGRGKSLADRARCDVQAGDLATYYESYEAGGGPAMMIETTQIPANDRDWARIISAEELAADRAQTLQKNFEEVRASNGYIGQKKLSDTKGPNGEPIYYIQTPGKSVEEAIAAVYNVPFREWSLSDEINEIVNGAHLNTIARLIGTRGGNNAGLLGGSSPQDPGQGDFGTPGGGGGGQPGSGGCSIAFLNACTAAGFSGCYEIGGNTGIYNCF